MPPVILKYKDRFRKTPQLAFNFGKISADNFAGGGGASTGIEAALGRPVDIAINHDPVAIAMHKANHPGTHHECESVWKINPRQICGGRPVGLAWFSPDCFPAGTMILTDRGYRRIETIEEGDRVLTHDARYRRVYATMKTVKAVRGIDIQGVPTITVSDDHPVYARAMHNVWDNRARRYSRTLLSPEWVAVKDLRTGIAPMNAAGGDRHFCATPCAFEALPIPPVAGRGLDIDERLMWLAGRYLGDGWSRIGDGRAELVIICGKSEADDLETILSAWPRAGQRSGANELAWHRRKTETSCQFSTNHRGLVEWLRNQFGHGGAEKSIPAWCLSAPDHLRRSLLAGYVSADGSQFSIGPNYVTETVTISKALALSTKALVESLGFTATVSQPRKNSSVIAGRTVDAKPTFMVRWRETPMRSQTIRDGLHNWSRVQLVGTSAGAVEVFNLSVEGDETYIADGIVVHNCKHHSKARGKKPVDKKIRGLAWVAVRWMATVKPDVTVVENVEEFVSWGPLLQDANGEYFPCPARKGQTFKSFINAIRRQGYEVEWQELRACDYGAPTIRKRFFLVARCDGKAIVWPEPTHGNPKSAKVKSGQLKPWRTVAECIDFSIPCRSIFERKKPLVNATLKRIAKGVKRYVIDADEPFIVPSSFLDVSFSPKKEKAAAFLSEYTEENAAPQTLKAASIMRHFGESVGSALDEPVGAITAGGMGKTSLVVVSLVRSFGKSAGAAVDAPACTITSKSKDMLVTSHLVKLRGTCKDGQPITTPGPTLTAGGNHLGEVRTLLMKCTGSTGTLDLETESSPWLVTIKGEKYEIVDIGARMLSPRELYRVQGFTDDYIIDRDCFGNRITVTEQINKCGNSVCPPVAEALVRANVTNAVDVIAVKDESRQISLCGC